MFAYLRVDTLAKPKGRAINMYIIIISTYYEFLKITTIKQFAVPIRMSIVHQERSTFLASLKFLKIMFVLFANKVTHVHLLSARYEFSL